jgi:AraC-like DNA-binding protein
MQQDPLSDVLRSVRLRGAVFFYVSFPDDWVAEALPARELASSAMPGVEHLFEYHRMAKGEGWAAAQGEAPVHLATGDIVMFPRDDRAEWIFATRHDPKPIAVSYRDGVLHPHAPALAEEARNVIVCGFIGCDLKPFNPLLGALPRLLHLPSGDVAGWVRGVLHQAVIESRERRPGSGAVLERASEMVFVDAARRYLESLPEDAEGWLGGLRDRYVGKALGAIHGQPSKAWTVEDLGHEAGLLRSALHERFVRFAGQAPMQYLANWRMQLAANLLRSTHANVASIALDVDYDSEAAFTRAFKRATGRPPSAWRREQAGLRGSS